MAVYHYIELQSPYDQGMVEKHGCVSVTKNYNISMTKVWYKSMAVYNSHRTTIFLWPSYGRKAWLCIIHIELQSSYDQGMVEKHGCESVTSNYNLPMTKVW